MRSFFNTLSIRIGIGYVIMVVMLALIVLATLRQVDTVRQANQQLDQVRMPIVQASVQLLNGVNQSSAALRGWVFLRDSTYLVERKAAWEKEIDQPLQELQAYLARSSDRTAPARMMELVRVIDILRAEQQAAADAPTIKVGTETIRERSSPAARQARNTINALVTKQRALMAADLRNIDDQIGFLNTLQWSVLVIALAAALLLAVITTRTVVLPVTRAVEVADRIASGDMETSIDVSGTREISQLGAALKSMREALRSRMDQIGRHARLGDRLRALDNALRGEKDMERICTDLVQELAEQTGSKIGVVYLKHENEDLRPVGSYAMDHDAPRSFRLGEGAIGQAALDRKILRLDQVDRKGLRVLSGLVDTAPAHIVIAPFEFEGEVLGVIELGKFSAYSDEEMQFLQQAIQTVGIAVNSTANREKINDLLEETQRQSEELQVQHEELQQTNEELQDQTERLKVQQEELQVTNEELEEQTQTVAQRNAALEQARLEVERKAHELEITSRYKSEFLTNMSHELRTPLNSLLILSNHLAKNKAGNLKPDQVESAKVIAKSGYDLLNLINDILDLSKVEAGKLLLQVSEVPVSIIADDIRSAFTHMAEEKGLAFDVAIDPSVPNSVRTDQQRLGQVMKNLVSNAIKFTSKGSVSVHIAGTPEKGLAISVADTGIGIPKDKQELIFEAFQQVDGGTSRKFGGTGLGLSISRELSRLLGGQITLKSEAQKGSTFTLTIPAEISVQGNDTHSVPQGTPAAQKVPGRTAGKAPEFGPGDHVILIVEDDPNFAKVLSDQARSHGFKVLHVDNGEDGLEAARKYRPKAIMLDLELPGIDGHAVLRELKNDPLLRHIPVHILSATERTLGPIRAGAVEYLVKPVDQEQLDKAFDRIEDLVQRKMKNLLIVEDNENQRTAIKQLIGNGDVKCLEAGSAEEGLDILQEHPVDCIVLDIGLPDVSGSDLLKLYKEKMGQALPPIIVYTGRELSAKENDELRMYAETIIVKGIRTEERLLDETALFLHRAVQDLPRKKQAMILDLHDPDAIFKGRNILLVDDDMRNVFALNKVLTAKGFNVLRAENGAVALEMLEKTPAIDMVLMDIMMPEMDGYTAMRAIRAQRKWQQLPIIALTAKAMMDDRRKCIEAGANDYISKPIDEARLFTLMRIWLAREKS